MYTLVAMNLSILVMITVVGFAISTSASAAIWIDDTFTRFAVYMRR